MGSFVKNFLLSIIVMVSCLFMPLDVQAQPGPFCHSEAVGCFQDSDCCVGLVCERHSSFEHILWRNGFCTNCPCAEGWQWSNTLDLFTRDVNISNSCTIDEQNQTASLSYTNFQGFVGTIVVTTNSCSWSRHDGNSGDLISNLTSEEVAACYAHLDVSVLNACPP